MLDSRFEDGTYLIQQNVEIVNYGERWAYGYFVADGQRGVELDPETFKLWADAHISAAMRKVAKESGTNLVGVWTRPETGIIYIDPVNHISDRESAVKLGTERGELAIWDARDNVAITL